MTHSIRQYLIKGGSWALIGKLLVIMTGLGISAILARILTSDDLGTYFLALNLATFFSIIGRFGMDNTLLRYVSESIGSNNLHRVKGIIYKCILIALISSSLIALTVFFGATPQIINYLFKSNLLSDIVGFIAVWLVLLSFQFIISAIFRGLQDIFMSVLSGGLITSITTLLFIIPYSISNEYYPINNVLQWILVAGVINLAISFCVLNRRICTLPVSHSIENSNYSDFLGHSWPLLINAIMMFIMTQSSLWVIGVHLPDKDLAIYGVASRLVLMTGMALAIVNVVVPPLIAQLNVQNKKKQMEQMLRTVSTLASVPALCVLSVFIFWGNAVLGVIFGEFYRTGQTILFFLSLGQAVSVIVGSCGYTLIMTGHKRSMMLISTTSALIAISGSLIIVRSFGANGVAACYGTAMIVQQLAMLFFARYKCGVWTHAGLRYLSLSGISKRMDISEDST